MVPSMNSFEILDIAAGDYSSLILTKNRELFSMGKNNMGQLGLVDTVNRGVPVQIKSPIGYVVSQICAGESHSLITTEDGKIFSFGDNMSGCLGHGDLHPRSAPAQILSLVGINIRKISAGGAHSLVLSDKNVVYGFGNNDVCVISLILGWATWNRQYHRQ